MARAARLVCLLFLGGCGTGMQDPVWQSVQQAMSRIGGSGQDSLPVAKQQAAIRQIVAEERPATPLLMMTLPERAAVATLARVEASGDTEIWADASGITVALQDGVVVQTRGLGHDLMASDISGFHAARANSGPQAYIRVTRRLSAEGVLLRLSAHCYLTQGPARLTELCDGELSYENWYTRSEHPASRQWLGPSLGYIYIERLN